MNLSNLSNRNLRYPDGVIGGASKTPLIYNISLGKYDASVGFNGVVFNGPVAALLKWVLEWTKVAAAAERPIGVWFWHLADWSSLLLGRTLIPTPP